MCLAVQACPAALVRRNLANLNSFLGVGENYAIRPKLTYSLTESDMCLLDHTDVICPVTNRRRGWTVLAGLHHPHNLNTIHVTLKSLHLRVNCKYSTTV
jgi:hypothetical protein